MCSIAEWQRPALPNVLLCRRRCCIRSRPIPDEGEPDGPHLPRTPWPCTGAGVFRRSRTWRPRRGSRRRWGCPSPRTPAGSGSSGSGFACWSSSWRSVDVSPCGAPGRRPWEEQPAIKNQRNAPKKKIKEKRSLLPVRAVTDEFDILKIFFTRWFDGSSFSLGRCFHVTKTNCRKTKRRAAVVNRLLYTD